MGILKSVFDTVKDVVVYVYNNLDKETKARVELKEKYEKMSNSDLKKIITNDSYIGGKSSREKQVASYVLKSKSSHAKSNNNK